MGARQGGPIYPGLFNFVINWAVGLSIECLQTPTLQITDFDYTDNIVASGEIRLILLSMIDKKAEYAVSVKRVINVQ